MTALDVVALSDTHGQYEAIDIPDGDVLIFAGDITRMGSLDEVVEFDNYLKTLPHEHKIVIAGNHDFIFHKFIEINMLSNSTYLLDKSVTIAGFKFYGSPWTPRFGPFVFMAPRDGDFLKSRWREIPNDTDVLITHGPPWGISDWSVAGDVAAGDEVLLGAVILVEPAYHIFGHIHECGGDPVIEKHGIMTRFKNVSACNEHYKIANEPFVFQLSSDD